jgi:putative MATE family efflux protein
MRELVGWLPASEPSGLWGAIRRWRPDPSVQRLLWSVGGPAAAESGSVQLGFMCFSLIVISMGTDAFAAQQIVFNVANLSMMPGIAFSTAATTLVGQALGAGDPRKAESSTWRATASAAVWMALMGVVFICIPRPLMQLYTGDATVVALGVAGLQIIGYGQAFQGIAFVLSGALRGAGDTRTCLVVGTISMWLIRLPLAFGLGVIARLGLTGIWLAWFVDWVIRSGAYAWLFRRGNWRTVRL